MESFSRPPQEGPVRRVRPAAERIATWLGTGAGFVVGLVFCRIAGVPSVPGIIALGLGYLAITAVGPGYTAWVEHKAAKETGD